MTNATIIKPLIAAVENYFEVMFDSDFDRFDQVFAPTAQLHGLRDGNLRVLPAGEYRKLLASNPSPKSKKAPRQQEILLVDFASPTQALVKVRVRIDTMLYVDYLSFHLIDNAWLITAKSFHIERRFDQQERDDSH
jgi:Putative lumazine-binding